MTHVQALVLKVSGTDGVRFFYPRLGVKGLFAGADRERNFVVDKVVNKADENAVSQNKLVLRPLIGLMRGQAPGEIEHFVATEIKRHRRLRDEAVQLENSLEEAQECDRVDARRAYITAMIAVHAQQTVVSTLLDILGYIPVGVTEGLH